MDYHYETQPVPGPLSWFFHAAPHSWHKVEVLGNHFVELAAPWLLLLPPGHGVWATRIGGAIQVAFQLVLIASGNLSFLNWLTIVPAIACLDDAALAPLFGKHATHVAQRGGSRQSAARTTFDWLVFLGIAYLSIPVVHNLMSENQVMNGAFSDLKLVNTYGQTPQTKATTSGGSAMA